MPDSIKPHLDQLALIQRVHSTFDECGSPASLRHSATELQRIKTELAETQPPNYASDVAAIEQIRRFVNATHDAQIERHKGRIPSARRLESLADHIYLHLPKNWQW